MTGMEIISFDVPWAGKTLKCDTVEGCSARQTLLIHGAGSSIRGRFAPLRQAMHQRGIGSTAFDCVGHGDTGGVFSESSLQGRTQQAEAVIAAQLKNLPLAVVGTSMGAYNAIKLLQIQQVEALILVVPGVYTPEAYTLPFGSEFSATIRQERSWINTDAWEILGQFTGRLLVIAAENDTVIPAEIPERLVQSARQAAWRKLHVVAGAEHHRLFSSLVERPAEFKEMTDLIFTCLA